MKKLIALLLALVMVLGMFAACTPSDGGASSESTPNTPPETPAVESESPLVIQWDQATGTDQFEPPYKDNSLSYHTLFLWQKLYTSDLSKAKDDPAYYNWQLAKSIEMDEAGLVCTITLRDDAKWDDGEPVTGEDLAFTIMAQICDPISTSIAGWNKVKGYEELTTGVATELSGMKVDGNVVTIELIEANVNWRPNPDVLPAHCFEGVAWADLSSADYWKNPVGCGPYKVTEVNFPDSFKMTRSETYYGKPAGIKNVTAISIEAAGSDAAVAAVIAGDVDITTRTVTSEGPIASSITKQNSDCVSKAMYSDNIRSFAFNMGQRTDGKDKEILVNDVNARQAISLLIDEATIAAYCATDACIVMGNPNNQYTDHSLDASHKSLDVDKAKELLDAAGWDYDTEIDILEYYGNTVVKDTMDMIKTDAAKAGVKINHITVDSANAGTALYTDRNYDLMYYQAGNNSDNPAAALSNLNNAAWTFMYPCTWVPEKYATLISNYSTAELGSAAYKEAIAAIQKANYEDCLIIPVYVNSTVIVYNTKNIYVPDTAFDYYDNTLDLDQWIMLK